jgi:hypothetical protein
VPPPPCGPPDTDVAEECESVVAVLWPDRHPEKTMARASSNTGSARELMVVMWIRSRRHERRAVYGPVSAPTGRYAPAARGTA